MSKLSRLASDQRPRARMIAASVGAPRVLVPVVAREQTMPAEVGPVLVRQPFVSIPASLQLGMVPMLGVQSATFFVNLNTTRGHAGGQ